MYRTYPLPPSGATWGILGPILKLPRALPSIKHAEKSIYRISTLRHLFGDCLNVKAEWDGATPRNTYSHLMPEQTWDSSRAVSTPRGRTWELLLMVGRFTQDTHRTHKGLLGFSTQTQKSALMARPPPLNPVKNKTLITTLQCHNMPVLTFPVYFLDLLSKIKTKNRCESLCVSSDIHGYLLPNQILWQKNRMKECYFCSTSAIAHITHTMSKE